MSLVLKWEGTATATSSVVHGGQALGTVTYLRRERFVLPDGTMEEIPVVSGNAWRGILRDTAADLWWEKVGSPKLTLPVMHALWSGGSLAKSSGPNLTGSRLALLRKLCPVVGLFGTAGGGRIINGALQVGKLLPICTETAHLIPEEYHKDTPLPSMWDITQVEYYSRFPDKRPEVTNTPDDTEDTPDGSPARYGVESFLAGTEFYTWCTLTWPTDDELAFFTEVLDTYCANAHVGGLGRAGHGRLRFNLTPPDGLPSGALPAYVPSDPPEDGPSLLEVLAWLD